ncbi:hypothetical protein BAUCODRAFT_35669 [Baudoinia panamericana UAMH 10762]|uniref:Uncharacterized protein n=1 Tax=Baudoinia panamericana (strain UAMH 10762) TaxID=717646 RepID=M2N5Y9_BAUPA|nr:uncharacterized protein BAUCODRAFT_35669 [Baudoinia panamericana UAMH 10762]EMC94449.1 hypothetical protein BAUCODRAFT_35669 [Baudoinia panamericana UAMH 10762]
MSQVKWLEQSTVTEPAPLVEVDAHLEINDKYRSRLYTFGFSVALAIFTKAQRQEVFAATAA